MDGDGDPDLVFGNGRQDRLYLNLLRQLDAPFPLLIGRDYTLEAYARHAPPSTVLTFVSARAASIPLPSLGTMGIDPALLIPLPRFSVSQPAGVGSRRIAVPNLSSLVGNPVYFQSILRDPAQDRLTNVVADVVLR